MGLREYLSKLGSHFIILRKYGSHIPILLFLSWVILIIISEVIRIVSRVDILYFLILSSKDKIDISLVFAIACFAGVQTIREIERRKIEMLQNELEKAYGPIYSILMKPDEMSQTKGTEEYAIIRISPDEKNALDKIIKTYPFMFPYDIVVLWRVEIRDMMPYTFYAPGSRPRYYAIPLKLREKIKKEYDRRVIEYYEATGKKREAKIMSHPLT